MNNLRSTNYETMFTCTSTDTSTTAACSCGSLCFERPIADGAAGVRGLRIRACEHKRC